METLIGKVIKDLRKEKGISQENLAQAMGVSVQAVSKWETQNSYPDIILIPEIAKFFNVSIDYLFFGCEHCNSVYENKLPDDDILRIVQYKGNRMLTKDTYDNKLKIKLKIDEDVYKGNNPIINVEVWGSADINGNISGGVNAGDGVNCGNVSGAVSAGDGVNCGNIGGGVSASDGVDCGNISGAVSAGDSVNCGNINGGVSAGDSISCSDIDGDIQSCAGDVHCRKISGNVSCDGSIYYDK